MIRPGALGHGLRLYGIPGAFFVSVPLRVLWGEMVWNVVLLVAGLALLLWGAVLYLEANAGTVNHSSPETIGGAVSTPK